MEHGTAPALVQQVDRAIPLNVDSTNPFRAKMMQAYSAKRPD